MTYLDITEEQHDVIVKLCQGLVVTTQDVFLDRVQVDRFLDQLVVVREPSVNNTTRDVTRDTPLSVGTVTATSVLSLVDVYLHHLQMSSFYVFTSLFCITRLH